MKHRCLSVSTGEYRGTSLSHYFQFTYAADPKAVGEKALLLCYSCPRGRECMELWLCLLIHCQHSWTGVEGEVTCTRKRAGTDYIICRVRGKQGPHWNWVTATVPCFLCGHQGSALPFIQGRVQWCQASLWFLLLLHSFICDLERICSSVQKSLHYYKNNSGTNPYWLHVLLTCFIFQCLRLFASFCLSLHVLAKNMCATLWCPRDYVSSCQRFCSSEVAI